MLSIDCAWIGKVWKEVVADVAAGRLGPAAKVSTCKSLSPLASRPGKHVVCVYTSSWRDEADVQRVALQLVKTAGLKRMTISYKSDEQTLAGEYQWSADAGVALYTFKPPYNVIIKTQRSPGSSRPPAKRL